MTETAREPHADGGCTCRRVRYRMRGKPMFTNCCHCRWCQRETGSAFVINAMIEAGRVELLGEAPELINTPSESGRGQLIARCPACHVAVWSHYGGSGRTVCFIRVGTLDNPDEYPPDIHIFTTSKQPWVVLPAGTPAMPEYYELDKYWPAESLERRRLLRAQAQAQAPDGRT